MKLFIVADPHIGADRFGVSAARWDEPLWEAAIAAVREAAVGFVIAGDMHHKRHPTTDEYYRGVTLVEYLVQSGIEVLIINGNHDVGMREEDVAATWPYLSVGAKVAEGCASIQTVGGFEVVALPWPRAVDYELPQETPPHVLADKVMEHLVGLCQENTQMRPRVLIGHAMVANRFKDGRQSNIGEAPAFILGRDPVLPYAGLRSLRGVAEVQLGHVHHGGLAYVGSTQPTDWGEATDGKSYTILEAVGGDKILMTTPSYTTSLRLLDHTVMWGGDESALHLREGAFDRIRVKITVPRGVDAPDPAAIRRAIGPECLGVEVVKLGAESRRRVEDVQPGVGPITSWEPVNAFDRWLADQGVTPEEEQAALKLFRSYCNPAGATVPGAVPTGTE